MKGIGIVLFFDYEIAEVYYDIQGDGGILTLLELKLDGMHFGEKYLPMQLKCQDGKIRTFAVFEGLEDEKFKIRLDEPTPDK